jgi:hypothetical protein
VINFYLKEKPADPVTLEIMDATGKLKTLYTLKDAEAGINRLYWDMRFDPSPQAQKAAINNMKNMMDRILGRPEVEPEAKATVEEAFKKLEDPSLTYREAAEIQRKAFEAIGFGGGRFMGRGRGGGAAAAEPGAYAVKLTVNGKTYDGALAVRMDPKQTGVN